MLVADLVSLGFFKEGRRVEFPDLPGRGDAWRRMAARPFVTEGDLIWRKARSRQLPSFRGLAGKVHNFTKLPKSLQTTIVFEAAIVEILVCQRITGADSTPKRLWDGGLRVVMMLFM